MIAPSWRARWANLWRATYRRSPGRDGEWHRQRVPDGVFVVVMLLLPISAWMGGWWYVLPAIASLSMSVCGTLMARYGRLHPRHWTSRYPIEYPRSVDEAEIIQWCRANCRGRWRLDIQVDPDFDRLLTSGISDVIHFTAYFSCKDEAAMFRLTFC